MKKLIVAIFIVSLFLPAICLAADAGVINHVMAAKIEYVQGKGHVVVGPVNMQFMVPAGSVGAKHKFTTLDQLLFMKGGTFKVEQKIVEDATGQVVSAANRDSFTVKNSQTILPFVTDWDFGAKVGVYTYQIVANNEVIAAYKISIIAAQ